MPIEFYSAASGGAISTIMMQVAKELIELGHHVTVLTKKNADACYDVGDVIEITAPDKTELTIFQRIKCKIFRDLEGWDYPYYGVYLDSFTAALQQLRIKPDVVMVFNDLVSPYFIKRVLPKTKVGVWFQNEQITRFKKLHQSIQSTDRYLTCSNYIRDRAIATHHLPTEKVVTAASGVDTTVFYPRDDSSAPKNGNQVKAVYVGRIDPNKGPDIAVRAVRKITSESKCSVPFTIAGDVWFYASADVEKNAYRQRLVDELETLDQKIFLGHVSHAKIAEIYRENDVAFVLSRTNEPFGLVSLEAMASGCAVIASNRGGLPEACGTAGILVNPDNQEEVDTALRRLCKDRDWLSAQRKLSLERAAQATWRETARVFVESFTE